MNKLYFNKNVYPLILEGVFIIVFFLIAIVIVVYEGRNLWDWLIALGILGYFLFKKIILSCKAVIDIVTNSVTRLDLQFYNIWTLHLDILFKVKYHRMQARVSKQLIKEYLFIGTEVVRGSVVYKVTFLKHSGVILALSEQEQNVHGKRQAGDDNKQRY